MEHLSNWYHKLGSALLLLRSKMYVLVTDSKLKAQGDLTGPEHISLLHNLMIVEEEIRSALETVKTKKK